MKTNATYELKARARIFAWLNVGVALLAVAGTPLASAMNGNMAPDTRSALLCDSVATGAEPAPPPDKIYSFPADLPIEVTDELLKQALTADGYDAKTFFAAPIDPCSGGSGSGGGGSDPDDTVVPGVTVGTDGCTAHICAFAVAFVQGHIRRLAPDYVDEASGGGGASLSGLEGGTASVDSEHANGPCHFESNDNCQVAGGTRTYFTHCGDTEGRATATGEKTGITSPPASKKAFNCPA